MFQDQASGYSCFVRLYQKVTRPTLHRIDSQPCSLQISQCLNFISGISKFRSRAKKSSKATSIWRSPTPKTLDPRNNFRRRSTCGKKQVANKKVNCLQLSLAWLCAHAESHGARQTHGGASLQAAPWQRFSLLTVGFCSEA